MANENVATNNGKGKKYRTRYGEMTADKAAYEMLMRCSFRLIFLKTMFSACGEASDGDGFTLPDFSACGVAHILEDIEQDLSQAHFYYCGHNDEPGRTGNASEVSHD